MSADRTYKAIVVGTSAGGLQALSFILEKIPKNYPLPFIIVQHRAKDTKNLLEEVMQNKCEVEIKQASEKEKIEKSTVYIAPADYHLLIENDHTFSLSSDELVNYSRPSIDVLFESAAEVYKNQLIGIILTGSNSDGTIGMSVIQKSGGLTIAQNPLEAQFPVMPAAAIEAEVIQHVWTLSEIREFLLTLYLS